jgi:hypothetical protein
MLLSHPLPISLLHTNLVPATGLGFRGAPDIRPDIRYLASPDRRPESGTGIRSNQCPVSVPSLIFCPARFQLLFWNPFTSEQELEDQDWYREIATYALDAGTVQIISGTAVVDQILLYKYGTLLQDKLSLFAG